MITRRLDRSAVVWSLLGGSLSLLSVEYLRLPLAGQSMPIPVLVLLAAGALMLVRAALGVETIASRLDGGTSRLLMSLALFWCWHLVAALRSGDLIAALSLHGKITLGMICFTILVLEAGRIRPHLERIWRLNFLVTCVVLVLLMYRYAVVFKLPFLGVAWDSPTRFGKNQLGWFLAASLPYLAAYWFTVAPLARIQLLVPVHALAWLYTASRGSWLCGGLGVGAALAAAAAVFGTRKAARRLLLGLLPLLIFGGLAWATLDLPVDLATLDLVSRLVSDEGSGTNSVSDAVRNERLDHHLGLFDREPLWGVGLLNAKGHDGVLSHNDYLTLMTDLGLLGLALFIIFLLQMVGAVWLNRSRHWTVLGAKGSVLSLACYLALINVFESPMFWVFAGLALVPVVATGRREASPGEVA